MSETHKVSRLLTIGVLSDTHFVLAEQKLPGWVVRAFGSVDVVLHAGDIEHPALLQDLERFAPVYAVRGNCDFGLPDLPQHRLIQVPGGKIALAHRPQHAWAAASADTIAIVHGHTHIPVATCEDGRWIINPGSPRLPRGGNPPSVLILRVQDGTVEATFKYPEPCVDE